MIEILDFYADWCKPCHQLVPILEELKEEFDYINVIKINVEDESELLEKYEIRGIPTLIILKNKKMVDKVIGSISKLKLIEIINKHNGINN